MKGSTRGARHLAESANWLAWQCSGLIPPLGTLMQTALAHWSLAQFDAFVTWYRGLPSERKAA
jgi:hypothetical protein